MVFPPHKTLVGQDLSQLSYPGGLTGLTGRGLTTSSRARGAMVQCKVLAADCLAGTDPELEPGCIRSQGSYWE